jgi:hypothetical protein
MATSAGGIALGDVNGDRLMDVGCGVATTTPATTWATRFSKSPSATAQPTLDRMGRRPGGQRRDYGMFSADFADIDNDGDLVRLSQLRLL